MREKYIDFCNKELPEPARSKMIEQINNFYNLQNLKLNNEKYDVGEAVVLKKNTFLHGFGSNLSMLEKYATDGLIARDFIFNENKQKKIKYCVSLWHIHKKIELAHYINLYSGMTFYLGKDNCKIVSYKKVDEFIETLRNKNYFSINAETTMEARFLPSLQKDGKLPKNYNQGEIDFCRQLAFVINGRDKACKELVKNNLLDDSLSLDIVFEFMRIKNQEHIEMFKRKRRIYEDERIAYLLFGLPQNMIEGVFVGRLYEKNQKVLSLIKKYLPNCYICNLDGKVIVGNKT